MRLRFLNVPRNGVITSIISLAIADLLHALRPTFVHPQNSLDSATRFLVAVLLFGPFLFGLVSPLGTIFMRLCDSRLRKSYTVVAFRNDMSWYVLLAFVMFPSYRYGWLLNPNP